MIRYEKKTARSKLYKLQGFLVGVMFLFLWLLPGSSQNVWGISTYFSLQEYNLSTKLSTGIPFGNEGEVNGIKTLNLQIINSGGLSDIMYQWNVRPEGADQIVLMLSGKDFSIGRIMGIKEGDVIIDIKAQLGASVIWTYTLTIHVVDTELPGEIFSKLYTPGTQLQLPSRAQLQEDFAEKNPSHPRIMTNAGQMELTEKFLTYAGLLGKASEDFSRYEQAVYQELNQMYHADAMPEEYFQKLGQEYEKICQRVKEYLQNPQTYTYQFEDGNLCNMAGRIENEVEQVGICWLLHQAHSRNLAGYGLEEEIDEVSAAVYPKRIREIMDMVTGFPDWNPAHFLDVGSLSYGMGMAYDWIYDTLSEEERRNYAARIETLGVSEGFTYLRSFSAQQRLRSNWTANICGGLSVAAMAIWNEEGVDTARCARIVTDTTRFLPVFLNQMSPDGAVSEGTGYWILSMRYTSYLLSSMEYTFGSDYGLMDVDGFEKSWYLPIRITGKDHLIPSQTLTYNFSDAQGGKMAQSALVWFAEQKSRKLENEDYLDQTNILMWYKNNYTDVNDYTVADAQDLLWYPRIMARYQDRLKASASITEEDFSRIGIEQDQYFGSEENITNADLAEHGLISENVLYGRGAKISMVTITDEFLNPKSPFFAVKDNNSKGAHLDLDAGSFVFDSLGVRWANELGKTTYSGERYQYYVKRAEGHNTLVINPSAQADQNTSTQAATNGTTSIRPEDYKKSVYGSIITYDLSNAYNVVSVDGVLKKNQNQVRRGFLLYDHNTKLLIQDEFELEEASDIYWFLQTLVKEEDYQLADDGRSVIMSKKDADGNVVKMKAVLNVTTDQPDVQAKFTLMDYQCMDESLQNVTVNKKFAQSNAGYKKLAIHISEDSNGNVKKVSKGTVTVLLVPIYDENDLDTTLMPILPISLWEIYPAYCGKSELTSKESVISVKDIGETFVNPISMNGSVLHKERLRYVIRDSKVVSLKETGEFEAMGYGTTLIGVQSLDFPGLLCVFEAKVSGVTEVKLDTTSLIFEELDSQTLTAVCVPSDIKNTELIWSSDCSDVAQVDENGEVTAVGYGNCVIRASWKQNPDIYAECMVQVRIPQQVTLDKTKLLISRQMKGKIRGKVCNEDAVNKNIIYSSENEEVVTVSQDGTITIVGNGTCNIQVSAEANPEAKAFCEVTVCLPETVKIAGPADVILKNRIGRSLKAVVYPIAAQNKEIIWSSSNEKVAKVNKRGMVTAVGNGTCEIFAVCKADQEVMTSVNISVMLPVGLYLSRDTITFQSTGNSKTLRWILLPVGVPEKRLKWRSDNSYVASVNGNGKVTARHPGSCTITVSSMADSRIYRKIRVTVKGK